MRVTLMDVGQCQGSFLQEVGRGRKGYLLGMGDVRVYLVERMTPQCLLGNSLLGSAEAERSCPGLAWPGQVLNQNPLQKQAMEMIPLGLDAQLLPVSRGQVGRGPC